MVQPSYKYTSRPLSPYATFSSVLPARRQLVRAVRVLAPLHNPWLGRVWRVRSLEESTGTGRSRAAGAVGHAAAARSGLGATRRAERDPGAVGRARALGGPAGVWGGADRARKVDAPVEVRCNGDAVRVSEAGSATNRESIAILRVSGKGIMLWLPTIQPQTVGCPPTTCPSRQCRE